MFRVYKQVRSKVPALKQCTVRKGGVLETMAAQHRKERQEHSEIPALTRALMRSLPTGLIDLLQILMPSLCRPWLGARGRPPPAAASALPPGSGAQPRSPATMLHPNPHTSSKSMRTCRQAVCAKLWNGPVEGQNKAVKESER